MKHIRHLVTKYSHALPLIIYGIIYWIWFWHLEETVTGHYRVIHMAADDYIPFCELFVVPYYLWFLYVSFAVLFLFFHDKTDYYRTCVFLFTGMTIFLIVSTLWPNGHHLRPAVLPRDNIFTDMVRALWKADTPTNLWPSIHVYNALGTHFSIVHSETFAKRRAVKWGSFALCSSIILSTVFIKQHSVFDVLTAFALAAVMYLIVYRFDPVLAVQTTHRRRKADPQIIR